MRVYLDDIRTPPNGWTLVKTVDELRSVMRAHRVTHLSLDHDLGEGEPTGYDWLCEYEGEVAGKLMNGESVDIPEIQVHSANPVGVYNMNKAIASLKRLVKRLDKTFQRG